MSSKLAARLFLAGLVAGVLPACGNINDGHPPVPFTVLASQSTAGLLANQVISRPVISRDGRFVVFATLADTLVPGDTNGFIDVFRRNLATGVTELVSIGVGGVPTDGDSENPSVSSDGRWVAFESSAGNLTAIAPGPRQVYVRDMNETVGNGIRMVSESAADVPGDEESVEPSISADGQYVAFASLGTTFGDAHANNKPNIYRRDMSSSAVLLITISASAGDPTPGPVGSRRPSISADGSRIAYMSDCSDLDLTDFNSLMDVFVATVTGSSVSSTVLASPGTLGLGGGIGESTNPALSADGQFVTYESKAFDLVALDTNIDQSDIFVFDMVSGTVQLVSVNEAGFQGSLAEVSGFPSISQDGRFIAFESFVSNLVPGDTNQAVDVFIKDMVKGTVSRISVDTSGQPSGPNQNSRNPSLSDDARAVVFLAEAAFVKSDLNGLLDAYVRSPLR